METILITGATGSVGSAILDHFTPSDQQRLYRGTRHRDELSPDHLYFDLEDLPDTIASLSLVDTLFLLRPPQIADEKIFRVLLRGAKEFDVKHIVFLSVLGAESTSFIPHAKIEKLIRQSGIPYTFIRPSYFTDNLEKVFGYDIRERNQIYIPAGDAKFLWVDVADIGRAIAAVLADVRAHVNQAYTITGRQSELLTFGEVADILSQELQRDIKYISPNPVSFFITKKKEGVDTAFIGIMFALHYVERFRKTPVVHYDLEHLIGQPPATVRAYVQANVAAWQK
ncbi:MAG: NmrA family NAD(P)-binding protein [Tunicatimonas sp.]